MASFFYNLALRNALQGKIAVGTDTFRGMLLTNAHTPNQDTHEFRSSLTNEVTGTGYTAGGATVTLSLGVNTGTDVVTLTVGALSWPASTITARYLAIYKSRGGAAGADELVMIIENKNAGTPGDVISTGGTLDWPVSTYAISNPLVA